MRHFIYSLIIVLFCTLNSWAQTNRFLRKAARSTENGSLEKAKEYYLKILATDQDNYRANVALGITLSEFQDQYEEALPYLEKAYAHTPKDTLPDLLYALAKCYQHAGQFEKAVGFLEKLNGSVALDEEDKYFQLDLKKRKQDCAYAMANNTITSQKEWYVINLGSSINSKMPEYVPVITPENELLFTSRRKDHEKEKINDLDGKYFESMYISKIENGKFETPRRYTIPDLFMSSKFRKHHESVISMSPDGKKLFVYRDNKIYEIEISDVKKSEPKKLSKNINFDSYQNHAYLSKDEKQLFFTSEAKGGFGGLDIYRSVKGSDGIWGTPENLGPNVNTAYDEDAPFLSNDGQILYFASRGLPGYGNFDLYKSELGSDGKWGIPQNLGMPINSQAHDIFMVQNKDGNIGYFSSARPGGKGDMDIYKINYLKDYNKRCETEENPLLSIKTETISSTDNRYAFTATVPEYLKVLKYEWKVNNSDTKDTENYAEAVFTGGSDNHVKLRAFVYCDTCFEPIVLCNIVRVNVVATQSVDVLANNNGGNTAGTLNDLKNFKGKLSNEQLAALGFNVTPVRFNFNASDVREDAKTILDKNIEVLKANPDLKLEVYGYADTQGRPGYNKNLSDKRARNIKDYMVQNGVNKKQIIIVVGKGATNLVNDCVKGEECDKEHNEMNRRVEFTVIKK